MNAATILGRSPDVKYEVVGEDAILVRMNTGTVFSLNKIGTEFWGMLDGVQSIKQHADALAAKYNVASAMVESDLLELAGKMKLDDLVVES